MPDINDPNDEDTERGRLPETPAERVKRRHAEAEAETDDERSDRRAEELATHLDSHAATIASIHTTHPAPFSSRQLDWENDLSDAEKLAWNERARQIGMANRAYHLAVRRTFEEHRAEDRHVAQALAKKEGA